MAITDLATVKTLADLFDLSGSGAPTTATVGTVGDIYMDTVTGLSYQCTDDADPYVWAAYTTDDAKITLFISKAEQDYLQIRGIAFELDDSDATVYPDGSSYTAAEMVCYLMNIGGYDGRSKKSESISDRSNTYDPKIGGYDSAITSSIVRYLSNE